MRDQALMQLHSIRDFIRWGASHFAEAGIWFGHGTDNAWDEAVVLVCAALHLPVDGNPNVLDARLTDTEKLRVLELLERRVTERLPAPYITGEAWFAGLKFHVDERVLVPRSPLAELIDQSFKPWLAGEPESILDLCTGSGCIGIACAYQFPDASVDLSDISQDALAVAELNIATHQLVERVSAVHSDGFDNIESCYDLIVSNPPYVDAADLATMPEEYRREPALALASGNDGLEFTRRVLSQASNYLSESGVLMMEVGNSWLALGEAYPHIPFTWLELERGGHGVFVLTRAELEAAQASLT